jgi:DNA repair protein RadA/Sms
MTDKGLMEVANPSALFLSDHGGDVNGAAVFAGIEGTRPMLVELQTLIAPSPLGTPRRAVVGWDAARLAMVLAVLESRCDLAIGANDVYLNVAGGLRVSEPAADLAVAAALASSLSGVAVPPETVVFGEIGLSGEVRPVSHTDARLKEATKLGFTRAIVPKKRGKSKEVKPESGMEIREIEYLADLLSLFHTPSKGVQSKDLGESKG